jgi:hypothetical protein
MSRRTIGVCPSCKRRKGIKATGKIKLRRRTPAEYKEAPFIFGEKRIEVQVQCLGCRHVWYSRTSEAMLAYNSMKSS